MDHGTGGSPLSGADKAVLFEQVFKEQFKALHSYALMLIRDEAAAEEIVQQVFYKLWEQQEQATGQQSVTAYLYRSVHNACLNHMKHARVKDTYRSHVHLTAEEHGPDTDHAALRELQQRISEALSELPEQCRAVFQMCRYEDMKYRDVAARLGISVKTVENHMGKALKLLRTKLTDYLPVICLLFINVKN